MKAIWKGRHSAPLVDWRVADTTASVVLLAAALLGHREVGQLEGPTDVRVGPQELQARFHPVGRGTCLPHVPLERRLLFVVERIGNGGGQAVDPLPVLGDQALENVERGVRG